MDRVKEKKIELESNKNSFNYVDIHLLKSNPKQPRKRFEKKSLNDLANSLKAQGILMPIIVRPKNEKDEKFEIVAGERRWRAAQIANIHQVPIVINNVADKDASIVALIENVQREDLNAIEEAEAYNKLILEYKMTQEEISDSTGKSRSHIANLIRLNKLPAKIKEYLINNIISSGHARALLSCKDPSKLISIVIDKRLSVRETEDLVRLESNIKSKRLNKLYKTKDPNIRDYERSLSLSTGLNINIIDKKGKGKLIVEYSNLDQLEKVANLISGENN